MSAVTWYPSIEVCQNDHSTSLATALTNGLFSIRIIDVSPTIWHSFNVYYARGFDITTIELVLTTCTRKQWNSEMIVKIISSLTDRSTIFYPSTTMSFKKEHLAPLIICDKLLYITFAHGTIVVI